MIKVGGKIMGVAGVVFCILGGIMTMDFFILTQLPKNIRLKPKMRYVIPLLHLLYKYLLLEI